MQHEFSGVRLLKAGLNPDHNGAQLSELARLTATNSCIPANASETPRSRSSASHNKNTRPRNAAGPCWTEIWENRLGRTTCSMASPNGLHQGQPATVYPITPPILVPVPLEHRQICSVDDIWEMRVVIGYQNELPRHVRSGASTPAPVD